MYTSFKDFHLIRITKIKRRFLNNSLRCKLFLQNIIAIVTQVSVVIEVRIVLAHPVLFEILMEHLDPQEMHRRLSEEGIFLENARVLLAVLMMMI